MLKFSIAPVLVSVVCTWSRVGNARLVCTTPISHTSKESVYTEYHSIIGTLVCNNITT